MIQVRSGLQSILQALSDSGKSASFDSQRTGSKKNHAFSNALPHNIKNDYFDSKYLLNSVFNSADLLGSTCKLELQEPRDLISIASIYLNKKLKLQSKKLHEIKLAKYLQVSYIR